MMILDAESCEALTEEKELDEFDVQGFTVEEEIGVLVQEAEDNLKETEDILKETSDCSFLYGA
jgi:hypothetical protein